VITADLLHLPFTAAFDGIVSTAAFHWVLDHDRLFQDYFNRCDPEAGCKAQCGGGQNIARLTARIDVLVSLPNFPFLASFPYPGSIRMLKPPLTPCTALASSTSKPIIESAPPFSTTASHYTES